MTKKLLSLSIAATGGIQASSATRTLAGELVRYGVLGRTSAGMLRVRPGALRFPDDIARVKLTREHNRDQSRGYCTGIQPTADGIRASVKVSDGPDGDAALVEAADGTRDAFSFDVVDATVDGDEITDALVIAIGQVGIPAYDDSRIDTIAASAAERNTMKLAPEQASLLVELKAKDTPSDAEKEVIKALEDLAAAPEITLPEPAVPAAPAVPVQAAAAPAQIAASVPAVPAAAATATGGVATTRPQGGALGKLCHELAEAFANEDNKVAAISAALKANNSITAALSDLTYSSAVDVIGQPAWSGELWSGLEYAAEFDNLFVEKPMTSLKGEGWRFVNKLVMADYAGDKAAIPSNVVTVEPSTWAGARQAVGLDIDRAFFDFPTAGFLEGLFQMARESWKINMDGKNRAYVVAKAKAARVDEANQASAVIAAQPTLLKAVAVAIRALKRRRVGKPDWVYVNDEDLFTLLDTEVSKVLAYLELFDVKPEQLRSTSTLAAGTVYAGVKPAAVFRQFPGSPIKVEAQHLANAGVDQAFFGYWAIEEHHKLGIAKSTFTPA